MSEWRDISTAPRDGTPILIGCSKPGFYPRSCWWSDYFDSWVVREDEGSATYLHSEYVTHWMPLPDPPDIKSGPAEVTATTAGPPAVSGARDGCMKSGS